MADDTAEKPQKKKIIWVEDDKLLGALLAQKITAAGFDLYCATSGADGLKALEELSGKLPDLIMVDLLLPDMSGFDILEKLQKDARFSRIPCIVLSNLGKIADQERAEKLGAKRYLIKALYSLNQIVDEVRKYV